MVTTTNYIYDGFQLLGETDETGTVTRRYINEPDDYTQPIGHVDVDTGDSFLYHYDGQGNTRAVTDENENVTDTFTYDSWGDLLARTGMTNVPFQFGGEHGYYKDEELDTYYVMERVYDPSIARWTSQDPLGFIDGLNQYLYVMNGPLGSIDPSGHSTISDAITADCRNAYENGAGRGEGFATFQLKCERQIRKEIKTKGDMAQLIFDRWYQYEKAQPKWWEGLEKCPCKLNCWGTCRVWKEVVDPETGVGVGIFYIERVPIMVFPQNPDKNLWNDPQIPSKAEAALHPGAIYSMRSKPKPGVTGYNQCTYNAKCELITSMPGAGTVDYKKAGFLPHFYHDVEPVLYANWLDGGPNSDLNEVLKEVFNKGNIKMINPAKTNVKKYYEVRPMWNEDC